MTFFYSKQQACKPDSVPAESSARDIPAGFHHLSCPAITCRIHRPTPRHRASSPDNAGLLDLATHQAYGSQCCHHDR